MSAPDFSLPALVEHWAHRRTNDNAVTFLQDGENVSARLSYAELHAAAMLCAGQLSQLDVAGRPVLVLPRSGDAFAKAFLGCLYAGAIAVPCSSGPGDRGWARIAAIADDCRPAAAIGSPEVASLMDSLAASGVASIDLTQTAAPVVARRNEVAGNDIALLQYTSGTTSAPKGVMISHGNLAANLAMIRSAFRITERDVFLTWLPLFHDMGLIGNFCAALSTGVSCVLMPPASFFQSPRRWLEAIGRFGATISGAPNFGYELLVRRADQMDLGGLDLSTWDLAFCGAEVVRATTLRRFAETFAPLGFRSASFYPCYGLAEATVFVAGGERGAGFEIATSPGKHETVSCGQVLPGETIAIVDPENGRPLPDGEIGEIWVSGDHVAEGYWQKPELSRQTFDARIASDQAAYLRTGDLGWMAGDRLYFASRLKDLIVWRGANFQPDDIEAAAAAAYHSLSGLNAAFSLDVGNEERVVIVQETARSASGAIDVHAAISAISVAVVESVGLPLHDVVLVQPGSLPRTTSGKVQRSVCRDLYLSGALASTALGQRLPGKAGSA